MGNIKDELESELYKEIISTQIKIKKGYINLIDAKLELIAENLNKFPILEIKKINLQINKLINQYEK